MTRHQYLTKAACAFLLGASASLTPWAAPHDRSGYIDWGATGHAFPERLAAWQRGDKWSEDDNFFISRVRPRQRFVNRASQVNPSLDDTTDKNLIWWLPIGTPPLNALPGGDFDSDVFPAWAYITHLGDWSAPLARVPGALLDAAHRNGVPVSAVASIPYGDISDDWYDALNTLTDTGADRLADYLTYYGIDGIGYNSEFQARSSFVAKIAELNARTVARMRQRGNDAAQFIWYDGTNSNGAITFDCGLGDHNKALWGTGDNDHSALFLNYNWNTRWLLQKSVDNAAVYGRSPLDIYCGINIQGREPREVTDGIWTLMAQYPVSIGLWGGHSENMLFESRSDNAVTAIDRQRNYLERMTRWFSGSRRNPADTPALNESLIYSVHGGDFPGMARLMSARSALKWDLGAEPFFTAFNLGNGRFFNYDGRRCHNGEWYDISTQDYLPTWMWWWSDSWLGHEVSGAMHAEFTWDDAWFGGSCLRISGSTPHAYLHLFKTEYALQPGDRITIRYKRLNGTADLRLALSLKGAESTPLTPAFGKTQLAEQISTPSTPLSLSTPSTENYPSTPSTPSTRNYPSTRTTSTTPSTGSTTPLGIWQEQVYTVGEDLPLPTGSEAAVLALEFSDASDLDLRLGTIEIQRPKVSSTPSRPVIESARMMYADSDGADAKLIFSVPNDKTDEVCFNSDVNVSAFKIYAQADDEAPVLMGLTTSWAALPCNIPYSGSSDARFRLGVSALSLDRTAESEIAWSDPLEVAPVYIETDPDVAEPLPEDLLPPQLRSLTCQGTEVSDFTTPPEFVTISDDIRVSYTLAETPRPASRGLALGSRSAGFRLSKAGIMAGDPFAVEFSIRPADSEGVPTHLVSVRDKTAEWSINNFGFFRHTLKPDGSTEDFIIRDTSGMEIPFTVEDFRLVPGRWHRLRYEFDYAPDSDDLVPRLFCDGREIRLTSAHPEGLYPWGGWTGWTKLMHFEIGGYIHKKNPVGGVIDDVTVWPLHPASDSVTFDFETDPAADNLWHAPSAEGTPYAGIGFGLIEYDDTETEGQGVARYVTPAFAAGAPEAQGTAFTDLHTARWHAPGAMAIDSSVTSDGGAATLHYPSPSADAYPVILELTASAGTSYYAFLIKRDGAGIPYVAPDRTALRPVNALFTTETGVRVDEAGTYTLSLLDLSGRRLLSNDFVAQAGDRLLIHPEVQPGAYLLLLERDGQSIGAAIVVKQ